MAKNFAYLRVQNILLLCLQVHSEKDKLEINVPSDIVA
jgi:hypothetical protein